MAGGGGEPAAAPPRGMNLMGAVFWEKFQEEQTGRRPVIAKPQGSPSWGPAARGLVQERARRLTVSR